MWTERWLYGTESRFHTSFSRPLHLSVKNVAGHLLYRLFSNSEPCQFSVALSVRYMEQKQFSGHNYVFYLPVPIAQLQFPLIQTCKRLATKKLIVNNNFPEADQTLPTHIPLNYQERWREMQWTKNIHWAPLVFPDFGESEWLPLNPFLGGDAAFPYPVGSYPGVARVLIKMYTNKPLSSPFPNFSRDLSMWQRCRMFCLF